MPTKSQPIVELYGLPAKACNLGYLDLTRQCPLPTSLLSWFVTDTMLDGTVKYSLITDSTVSSDFATWSACDYATVMTSITTCDAMLPRFTCYDGKMPLVAEELRGRFCRLYTTISRDVVDRLFRNGVIDSRAITRPDVQRAALTILHQHLTRTMLDAKNMLYGDSALTQSGDPMIPSPNQGDGLFKQALAGIEPDPYSQEPCAPGLHKAATMSWVTATGGTDTCAPLASNTVAGQTLEIDGQTVAIPEGKDFTGLLMWYINQFAFNAAVKPTDWHLLVPFGGMSCIYQLLECWTHCCVELTIEQYQARQAMLQNEGIIELGNIRVKVVEAAITDGWWLVPATAQYDDGGEMVTIQSMRAGFVTGDVGFFDKSIAPSQDLTTYQKPLAQALQSIFFDNTGKCISVGAQLCGGFIASNTQFWLRIQDICCEGYHVC